MCVYIFHVDRDLAVSSFLSSESYSLSKYDIFKQYQILTVLLLKASSLLALNAVSTGEYLRTFRKIAVGSSMSTT